MNKEPHSRTRIRAAHTDTNPKNLELAPPQSQHLTLSQVKYTLEEVLGKLT